MVQRITDAGDDRSYTIMNALVIENCLRQLLILAHV